MAVAEQIRPPVAAGRRIDAGEVPAARRLAERGTRADRRASSDEDRLLDAEEHASSPSRAAGVG